LKETLETKNGKFRAQDKDLFYFGENQFYVGNFIAISNQSIISEEVEFELNNFTTFSSSNDFDNINLLSLSSNQNKMSRFVKNIKNT